MVATPTNVKDLPEFLKENKIDAKKLSRVLQKYVDKNCCTLNTDEVSFQMFAFREVIDNFIDLIFENEEC